MYYITEAPYLLLVFGLFAGLTSGAAFEASLKQKAFNMSQTIIGSKITIKEQLDIFIPFLGICGGTLLFLAGGLGLFSVSFLVSVAIAFPVTLLIGCLIWWQLNKVLLEIQTGGSQALDLDS